jgi:hypothetical protein
LAEPPVSRKGAFTMGVVEIGELAAERLMAEIAIKEHFVESCVALRRDAEERRDGYSVTMYVKFIERAEVELAQLRRRLQGYRGAGGELAEQAG